jgi:hypothetical protein
MIRCARSLCVLSLIVAATACGGGGDSDSDTLTEEQATQAFDSMAGALEVVVDQASAAVEGGSGSVSVSASCTGGGMASADGEFVTGQSFSLDVAFADCVVNAVKINGDLGYDATGSSTSVTLNVTGHLTFSGAVTGTCTVDASVTVTQAGSQLSGRICGIEIDGSLDTGPRPRR